MTVKNASGCAPLRAAYETLPAYATEQDRAEAIACALAIAGLDADKLFASIPAEIDAIGGDTNQLERLEFLVQAAEAVNEADRLRRADLAQRQQRERELNERVTRAQDEADRARRREHLRQVSDRLAPLARSAEEAQRKERLHKVLKRIGQDVEEDEKEVAISRDGRRRPS